MASIDNLVRQHKEIERIIYNLEQDIEDNMIEVKVSDIVKSISQLSGILIFHLRQEDEYIYPNLLNSNYENCAEIGNLYLKEMKDIAVSFKEYKTTFSTSRKILSEIQLFKEETERIFDLLKKRIEKENRELYPFLSKLNEREFLEISITKK